MVSFLQLSGILVALCSVAVMGCSTAAPAPTPEPGVFLPLPEDGESYRMSEVCEHIEAAGYQVHGTVEHVLSAEDLSGVIEAAPSLVRPVLEGYLGNGLRTKFQVKGLCSALNN
jgi:hypothetical protein